MDEKESSLEILVYSMIWYSEKYGPKGDTKVISWKEGRIKTEILCNPEDITIYYSKDGVYMYVGRGKRFEELSGDEKLEIIMNIIKFLKIYNRGVRFISALYLCQIKSLIES